MVSQIRLHCIWWTDLLNWWSPLVHTLWHHWSCTWTREIVWITGSGTRFRSFENARYANYMLVYLVSWYGYTCICCIGEKTVSGCLNLPQVNVGNEISFLATLVTWRTWGHCKIKTFLLFIRCSCTSSKKPRPLSSLFFCRKLCWGSTSVRSRKL